MDIFSGQKLVNAQAINVQAQYTSSGLLIEGVKTFSVSYQVTFATGNPDLRIYYQISKDDNQYFIPDGGSDIETSLTDKNMHTRNINPPAIEYLRIIVVGNVANPSDTIVDVWLNIVEEV